jgi:hypothetical protein
MSEWSKKHTIRFVFHDFEGLNHKHGETMKSSTSLRHGYQWKLLLYYPGGSNQSDKDTVCLSIFLEGALVEQDDSKVKAKYTFRVTSVASLGKEPLGKELTSETAKMFGKRKGWGINNAIRQDSFLNPDIGFLVNGTLTIEVNIQVYNDKSPSWGPAKTLHLDMITLLESAKESGDVKFQVGSEVFLAHLNILQVRAPQLAEKQQGCLRPTLP